MNDLRTAAQQALERLRIYHYGNGFAEDAECIADLEAALAQQTEPVEPVAWKQGNLVTFNEDPCPVLGGLFVQFWDGEEVAARVYANDLKALRQRCAKVNTAPPNQEPVAWMYKAEPWFDGHSWHETYETTMDKTLAYFKDKNARALCFVGVV